MNTEQDKLITQIRAEIRRNPSITAVELKKVLGGNKPAAVYALLLSEARQREESVAEDLAGEDASAQAADADDDDPPPDFWLVDTNGQTVHLEYSHKKRGRVYFRRA